MPEFLATKQDTTKAKIVRALMCAAGEHEPWIKANIWNGREEVVRIEVSASMHGKVYCCACKHCRALYVRRKDE